MPEEIETHEIFRDDISCSIIVPVECRLLSMVWDAYNQCLILITSTPPLDYIDTLSGERRPEKRVEFNFVNINDIPKDDTYTRPVVNDGFEYMCSISYMTREDGGHIAADQQICRECHNFLVFVKEEYPEPLLPEPEAPEPQTEPPEEGSRILDV